MGRNGWRKGIELRYLRPLLLAFLALGVLLALPWPVHAQMQSSPVFPSRSVVRSIAETFPAPRPVGDPVVATVPDNVTLTYSLSGTDAELFNMVRASGQLETRETLDYEAQSSYEVIVRATDSRGLYDTVTVEIVVSNVDEAGEVSLEETMLDGGTVIDALLVDPDGDLAAVSWQWAVSPDMDAWTDIEGAVFASYAPKPGDLRQFLKVRATYADGHGPGKAAEKIIEADIFSSTSNYLPEFPFSESGVRSVGANAMAGQQAGPPVLASDLDGDLLNYWLSGELSEFFQIEPYSGQIVTTAPLNYQLEGRYFGVVHVFDGRGGSASIAVGVDVGNIRTNTVLDPSPAAPTEGGTISIPAPSSAVDASSQSGPAATSATIQPVQPQMPMTDRKMTSELISDAETSPALAPVAHDIPTSRAVSGSQGKNGPPTGAGPGTDADDEPIPAPGLMNSQPPFIPVAGVSTVSPRPSLGMRPGEAEESSWVGNLFVGTILFILGALLVTGIVLMLRKKRNEERKTTLPPPTIGPERRIFPFGTFLPLSRAGSGNTNREAD